MSGGRRENRLFLGNLGTGKSTLLNCLIGFQVFESGVSWGEGITHEFQYFDCNSVTYMDIPGFADIDIIEQAAQAVTTALRQPGPFKLFFLVRFQNGHVVSEDLAMIESILDSIERKVAFTVIINSISPGLYGTLKARGRGFDAVMRLVNCGKYPTTNVCLMPTLDELADKTNAVAQLPQRLIDFVEFEAPTAVIHEDNVKDIDVHSFRQRTQSIRDKLETVRRENLVLLLRIEELEDRRNVKIDVSQLEAYPMAVVATGQVSTTPAAPYHAHSSPPETQNDCEQCLGITVCCLLLGPLGICCYFLFAENNDNRRQL